MTRQACEQSCAVMMRLGPTNGDGDGCEPTLWRALQKSARKRADPRRLARRTNAYAANPAARDSAAFARLRIYKW